MMAGLVIMGTLGWLWESKTGRGGRLGWKQRSSDGGCVSGLAMAESGASCMLHESRSPGESSRLEAGSGYGVEVRRAVLACWDRSGPLVRTGEIADPLPPHARSSYMIC